MGILDALADPQFRKDVGRGLLDAGNRGGVAGLLGSPVDAAAGVVNAGLMGFGALGNAIGALSALQMPQPITKPVGGSEWIGDKLQNLGFVSDKRNPMAEALASIALPLAAQQYGPKIPAMVEALQNIEISPPSKSIERGMIKIPGRGQIPETRSEVNKLADRFERILNDAGVDYIPDKSGMSPSRYFSINDPRQPAEEAKKYGQEIYKIRISDHLNKHGADFSVDPNTGKTFEEMIKEVQSIGVPIANKVIPRKNVGVIPDDVLEKIFGPGELQKMSPEFIDKWRKRMKFVVKPNYPGGGYWSSD